MLIRGCSIPNAPNLGKLGVKIHNCALLLDFPFFCVLNFYKPWIEWIERNVVISVDFAEKKQFKIEINVGQLVNHKDVRMISDDNISSSFEHVTGTRQYFHIMLLDVLSKIRQFGLCTFFLSCSAAKFHWVEILQVVARQCGETLTREQVNAMD